LAIRHARIGRHFDVVWLGSGVILNNAQGGIDVSRKNIMGTITFLLGLLLMLFVLFLHDWRFGLFSLGTILVVFGAANIS
jgi:hypothetical protein